MRIEDIFGDLPRLETERTLLRKVREQDADDMFAYSSDEETARHTTWFPHRTIEDTKSFIHFIEEAYLNKQVAPWGIEDRATGKFIGTAGFSYWNVRHARAEVAYVLAKPFWNKGYMTEIVRHLIEFGFSEMGLARIEARCMLENIGSAKVMEKAGMSYEGVLRNYLYVKGQHRDLKLYAVVK